MEYFIQLFGGITLSTAIIFLMSMIFIIMGCVKLYKFIVNSHDLIQDKEQMLVDIKNNVDNIKDRQLKLEEALSLIQASQVVIAQKQEAFEEQSKTHNLNKLRDRLLQSYRYYSSSEKNPLQAWTEMEKEAFDKLFKDYEELGGNGFMHSTVEPTMTSMEVIEMTNQERLTELMKSRKG